MTRIDGFDAAADDFASFADNLREAAGLADATVDDGVQTTSARIDRTAKRLVPVDDGNLRASIGYRRLGLAEYSVGATADYAADVELGTAPHIITPDEADALAFEGQDGELIFRQRVEHPGTPAQPYLGPARREHQDDLTSDIAAALNDMLRQVFST
jgi:HK97 gp10 family phage protein